MRERARGCHEHRLNDFPCRSCPGSRQNRVWRPRRSAAGTPHGLGVHKQNVRHLDFAAVPSARCAREGAASPRLQKSRSRGSKVAKSFKKTKLKFSLILIRLCCVEHIIGMTCPGVNVRMARTPHACAPCQCRAFAPAVPAAGAAGAAGMELQYDDHTYLAEHSHIDKQLRAVAWVRPRPASPPAAECCGRLGLPSACDGTVLTVRLVKSRRAARRQLLLGAVGGQCSPALITEELHMLHRLQSQHLSSISLAALNTVYDLQPCTQQPSSLACNLSNVGRLYVPDDAPSMPVKRFPTSRPAVIAHAPARPAGQWSRCNADTVPETYCLTPNALHALPTRRPCHVALPPCARNPRTS